MSALPLLTALALARGCAPAVAPQTLLSVARAESGLDPLAIGVNTRPHGSLHPASVREAVQQARDLAARGVDFDVGLTQINARNLPGLGLDLADAFDPCRNLTAGGRVLTRDYEAVRASSSQPQAALRATLSRYNTGDSERGVRNGYVAKVYLAAAQVVPALQLVGTPTDPAPLPPGRVQLEPAPEERVAGQAPALVSLDVFGRGVSPALVWSAQPAARPSRHSSTRDPGESP